MPFTNEVERIYNQPAFILHKRPFRNTSLILDLFTKDFGRISLVAKGATGQRSKLKGILQAFQPLHISWIRKTELGTVTSAETLSPPFMLVDDSLYAAMYINEIILKLTTKDDPHSEIFTKYLALLDQLKNKQNIEVNLRLFEKEMLQELGYELNLYQDAETHDDIDPDLTYEFVPGFGLVNNQMQQADKLLFSGRSICNFANNIFETESDLKFAKIVMKLSLQQLLGKEELKTRELFRSYLATKKH